MVNDRHLKEGITHVNGPRKTITTYPLLRKYVNQLIFKGAIIIPIKNNNNLPPVLLFKVFLEALANAKNKKKKLKK
jgi:hypothetical protein